jgi:hypothetical protein
MLTKKGITMFKLNESEYRDHVNDFDGICLECGEWTCGGVETDAEGYDCEECGAGLVMGAEMALIAGQITFEGE